MKKKHSAPLDSLQQARARRVAAAFEFGGASNFFPAVKAQPVSRFSMFSNTALNVSYDRTDFVSAAVAGAVAAAQGVLIAALAAALQRARIACAWSLPAERVALFDKLHLSSINLAARLLPIPAAFRA